MKPGLSSSPSFSHPMFFNTKYLSTPSFLLPISSNLIHGTTDKQMHGDVTLAFQPFTGDLHIIAWKVASSLLWHMPTMPTLLVLLKLNSLAFSTLPTSVPTVPCTNFQWQSQSRGKNPPLPSHSCFLSSQEITGTNTHECVIIQHLLTAHSTNQSPGRPGRSACSSTAILARGSKKGGYTERGGSHPRSHTL